MIARPSQDLALASDNGPLGAPTPDKEPVGAPEPVLVPADEQTLLLYLAQMTLAAVTDLVPNQWLDDVLAQSECDEPAAVFVTLTKDGQLRGCIGTLSADRAICDAVVNAAYSAALCDPRFSPVLADELSAIAVDISVLGPPVPLADPADLRPGIDGVIIERGRARALMLPEVATQFDWDGRQMVEATCAKAGLAAEAWREPGTRMSIFRTAHFGGPALEQ